MMTKILNKLNKYIEVYTWDGKLTTSFKVFAVQMTGCVIGVALGITYFVAITAQMIG